MSVSSDATSTWAIGRAANLVVERVAERYAGRHQYVLACAHGEGQVRDEHRQDYDPGRGGWGAQAQRLEIERRREVEERYADAQEGPGAVAGGGGDWKEAGTADNPLKRARSPDDQGDSERAVRAIYSALSPVLTGIDTGSSRTDGRRPRAHVKQSAHVYALLVFYPL